MSSDQDVPVGPPSGFDDNSRNEAASQQHAEKEKEKETAKEKEKEREKESCTGKRVSYGGSGMLTRHAVSLAQLPPPIEADAEEQSSDLFVPPPPEFNADGSSAANADEIVFAPPPQFCDNRQQNRVKIIGAIPKVANIQVKAPTGRLHSQ